MPKTGVRNLSPDLRNTPSSSKIEMARFNSDIELESGPSVGAEPALLRGLTTRTRQENGDHSRGGSSAALFKMQDAGGQDESVMEEREVDLLPHITVQDLEDAPGGGTPIEAIAINRG